MTLELIDGHPHDDELTAYVSDTLAVGRVEDVESHIFDCSRCAARLSDAARFEVLLHEAAASVVVEPAAVRPSRFRRARPRVGMVGGLWAAAAALAVMIAQHGDVDLDDDRPETVANASSLATDGTTWSLGCEPGEPGCSSDLLASIDPLVSVEPMSSWPESNFSIEDWSEPLDGEPCGSGEHGGSLVCPSQLTEPFSG